MGELVGNPKAIAEEIASANEAIATVEEGLAYIVGNTNTTGNTLAVGQFVYVKGHSTIPNGLRNVTASISNNGSITTNNTSLDTKGGLNTLNSNINTKPTFQNEDISGNATANYSISNNARIVYYGFGNSESRCCEYLIYTPSSGTTTIIKEVVNGNNITVSSSENNKITIANNSSNAIRGYFLIFSGGISRIQPT